MGVPAATSTGTISSRAGEDEKSPETTPPASGGGHKTSADDTGIAGTNAAERRRVFVALVSSSAAAPNAPPRATHHAVSPAPGRSFPVTKTGTFTDSPPAAAADGAAPRAAGAARAEI